LSLLGFVRPQLESRAAGGRRISDRVATLDAGEDGRTMCDEDDATQVLLIVTSVRFGGGLGMVECRRRPDLPWCSDADADASSHKRIDGVPCRCSGAAARSIEGRPAGGWRAVPVWELAAPARGVLGAGLVRRHDHHHSSVVS